jgi:hypothetical protein
MRSAFHRQTYGQTERANAILEGMLYAYVSPQQDNWEASLEVLVAAVATSNQLLATNNPIPKRQSTTPSRPYPAGVCPYLIVLAGIVARRAIRRPTAQTRLCLQLSRATSKPLGRQLQQDPYQQRHNCQKGSVKPAWASLTAF